MSETFICAHCGRTFNAEERNLFDGQELCGTCFDEETVTCEYCEHRIWRRDLAVDDIDLCQHCFNDHYTSCESCGRTIHVDDAYYEDDEDDYPYCHDCYSAREDGGYIRSYSYKPEPVFFGRGKRFFGVELEIDKGGQYDSNAGTISNIANDDERRIYIKHDGSLDDGMEIVTHPMTLDYHMNEMPWGDVMNKAVELTLTERFYLPEKRPI